MRLTIKIAIVQLIKQAQKLSSTLSVKVKQAQKKFLIQILNTNILKNKKNEYDHNKYL